MLLNEDILISTYRFLLKYFELIPSATEVHAALSTLTKFADAKLETEPFLLKDIEALKGKIPVKSKQASI